MNKFASYAIAVLMIMAVILAGFWLKGGKEAARPVAIFFAGWIVGAISMYIKAMIVYKS